VRGPDGLDVGPDGCAPVRGPDDLDVGPASRESC
jgi:hypothetical protein